MRAQVARGEIPLRVYENLRIVDPRHEHAHEFAAAACSILAAHTPKYFHDVTKGTTGPFYDAAAKPPKLLLSDIDEPNAVYLKGSDPPIIIPTRGLFTTKVPIPPWYIEEYKRAVSHGHTTYPEPPDCGEEPVVTNVPSFLVFLWHELGHHLKEHDPRFAALNVGKPEEGILYHLPITLLAEAGFRPEEGYYALAKLMYRPGPRITLPDLLDVHPSGPASEEIITAALAQSASRVKVSPGAAPSPAQGFEPLLTHVGAGHRSYVNISLKRRGHSGSAPLAQKLQALQGTLGELTAENGAPTLVRFKDLQRELLAALNAARPDDAARRALTAMVDELVRYSRRSGDTQGPSQLFYPLTRALGIDPATRAIGGCTELFTAATALLQALAKRRPAQELQERALAVHRHLSPLLEGAPPGFLAFLRGAANTIQGLAYPQIGEAPAWASLYAAAAADRRITEALLALGGVADLKLGELWVQHAQAARTEAVDEFCRRGEHPLLLPKFPSADGVLINQEGRAERRLNTDRALSADVAYMLLSRFGADPRSIFASTNDAEFERRFELLPLKQGELKYLEMLVEHPLRVLYANGELLIGRAHLWKQLLDRLMPTGVQTPEPQTVRATTHVLQSLTLYQHVHDRIVGLDTASPRVALRRAPFDLLMSARPAIGPQAFRAACGNMLDAALQGLLAAHTLNFAHVVELSDYLRELHAQADFRLPRTFAAIVSELAHLPAEETLPPISVFTPRFEAGLRDYQRISLLVAGIVSVARAHQAPPAELLTQFIEYMAEHHISGSCLSDTLQQGQRPLVRQLIAGGDPMLAARFWKASDEVGAISVRRLDSLLAVLVKRLDHEALPAQTRRETAEVLLGGRPIIDAAARDAVVNIWAKACAEELGKDTAPPGSAEERRFLARLDARLNDIGNFVPPAAAPASARINRLIQRELMEALAVAICSQAASSERLHAKHTGVTSDDLAHANTFGILGDLAFNLLQQGSVAREAAERFLVNKPTPASMDAFLTDVALDTQRLARTISQQESAAPFFGDLDRPSKQRILLTLHENFWLQPPEQRLVFAAELIGAGKGANDHERLEIFTHVSDHVAGGSAFARRLLRLIVDAEVPAREHFLLAALMTGARVYQRREGSLGRALAACADAHSVTARKFAQRAASSSDTPDELREGLQKGKADASKDPRPEVVAVAHELAPHIVATYRAWLGAHGEEAPEGLHIAHYGEQMGAASVYQNMRLIMSDGRRIVLGLVKQHIAEEAEHGKALAGRIIPKLHDVDQAAAQELNRHVAARVPIEIDPKLAPRQFARLGEVYGRQEIEINGHTHGSHAAVCFGAGSAELTCGRQQAFVLQEEILGRHFIDPLSKTAEAEAQHREDALFTFIDECSHVLQLRFCSDRHGGQYKSRSEGAQRVHGHFDAYALADFDAWSAAGREQLARFWVRAAEVSSTTGDFERAFLQAQREARARGEKIDDLILEVELAIQHYPEYTRELTREEMRRGLTAALAGPMDAQLKSALARELDRNSGALMRAWLPPDWQSRSAAFLSDVLQAGNMPPAFQGQLSTMLSQPQHQERIRASLAAVEQRVLQGAPLTSALSAELRALRDSMGPQVRALVPDAWLSISPEALFDAARRAAQAAIPEAERIIIRRRS